MIPRPHRSFRRLAFLWAALFLFCALPASAAIVSDDFNDGVLNEGLWAFTGAGTGPTVEERDQRLEIRLPSTSTGDLFYAGVRARSLFRGDLDVQVDFQALDYPLKNGVRIGIVIHHPGGAFASVQRTSLSEREAFSEPREGYILDTGGPLGRHPGGDLTGKLRLTRVGAVITGYYWDVEAGAWVPFASGMGPEEDVEIGLSVWSHDAAFGDQDVHVALDNFIVNKGQVVGPTLPDLAGRWLQLQQRIRGRGENQQSTVRGLFTVQNTGGQTAGPSVLRFFLSEDESLSADDLLLQQSTLRILRPRRRQRVQLRKALPRGVSARGWFVIAVVDTTSAVSEANESVHAVAGGPLR